MESNEEYTGAARKGVDCEGVRSDSVWTLAWQLIRFQVKLALDGLRDLVFSPASLAAVLLGLIGSREDPARYLRELMRLGRRSDRWINLFGEFDEDVLNADSLVEPLERAARRHYEQVLSRRGRAPGEPSADETD